MLSSQCAEPHQQSTSNVDSTSGPSEQVKHQQVNSEDQFESPDVRFSSDRAAQEASSFIQKWRSTSALHQSSQTGSGVDSNLRAGNRSPPEDRARHNTSSIDTIGRVYKKAPPDQSSTQSFVGAATASSSFAYPDAAPTSHELHETWLEAHPPFVAGHANNYHSITLSRYLVGRYPLPLPQELSQSISSGLPPSDRMNMANDVLRSGTGAVPQLFQWIESRLRSVCPSGSGDLTSWIYSEPDPARQWRVYWAIYDAFEAGVAHGKQQQIDESNGAYAKDFAQWIDLDATDRAVFAAI